MRIKKHLDCTSGVFLFCDSMEKSQKKRGEKKVEEGNYKSVGKKRNKQCNYGRKKRKIVL